MNKILRLISLALLLSMLLGAFAACDAPEQTTDNFEENSTEVPTDSVDDTEETYSESLSETETEIESEKVDVVTLEGDFGASILYADEIKNGVQAGYTDANRGSHYVKNLYMSAEFALTVDSEMKVSYIKNTKGQSYVENTMDTYIRMANGKTYYASDSSTFAKSNAYRIGYYYYDVHTLEQSFKTARDIVSEKPIDFSSPVEYNKNNIFSFEYSEGSLKYTVTGTDPFFVIKVDEGIAVNDWDAISITLKSPQYETGQLFVNTTEQTKYSSTGWDMVAGNEFRTYIISLSSLSSLPGNIDKLRFDIGTPGEVVEITDLKFVKLTEPDNDAPNVYFDRIWHTYSDKVHQDLHFTAPGGQKNIEAIGMITEIAADTVDKIIIKDKNGNHEALEDVDWASAEYIGFDIKGVGIFGYIMPYDNNSGSLKVTLEGGNYVIVQEYIPENQEMLASADNGDIHFGHRLYTDESHDFDEFLKQAEWERNPMKGITSSTKNFGYDALRGAYTFEINGTNNFFPPFLSSWNRHYTTSVTIKPRDKDRSIYVRALADTGCLESAVLLDSLGMVIPIPLEVSKNFTDGENPITNYGDPTWSETLFPLVVSQGTECEFEVINIYQNWGLFPVKQLSSIAFHAPYYHLSIGVTETSCISPWYVLGRTLWTLPDFRSVSAPYWFELEEGSGYRDQPQHTHADTPTIIQYTDADGNWHASENVNNTVLSCGPIYAEVEMDYITDDGKIAIRYNHLEMPQTDELRAYYEVEMEILEDISFKDFKNDFSFYGIGDNTEYRLSYVNEKDNVVDRAIESFKNQKEFTLSKNTPFFCLYDKRTSPKVLSTNTTNIGLLLKDWNIVIGGEKFDGNFIVINKRDMDGSFHLSLDLDEVILKAGDHIAFNIVITPWGSHLSRDASNMVAMRENTCLDPYKLTAIDGEVIESTWLPRFKSTNGNSAEFTISGGANNAAIRVYGFDKLTSPKIYEKIDDEWVEYQVSSINYPDEMGNMHYYDGYMTYYDGDGTYSYAFVVNMDDVESRTFKVEAIDDFVRWPKVEIINNDPINFHFDPEELEKVFGTKPGVNATVMEDSENGGFSFIRFENVGSKASEITLDIFSNTNNIPTGKYVVVKYREPDTNRRNMLLEFFTSTVNLKVTGSDSVYYSMTNDDVWHVVAIDANTYRTETFIPADDGQFYATHMRFDVFNVEMKEGEYVDIAYVGLCDSLEKLCELEKNGVIETIEVKSKNKTETISVATGEVVGTEEEKVPVSNTENVTYSKDFASFVDAANEQGYKVATDVKYYGRIDALCGYGPEGILDVAYVNKGSNTSAGVAVFEYNLGTTSDRRLVFSGWSLVWGGVEKYVWSVDGGKTWHDIEYYKGFTVYSASSAMCSAPANTFGQSVEEWTEYSALSCYQGPLKGPEKAQGIAANLTEYAGQTVNVTFAAVPKDAPDTLCILAHVTGVNVVE